MKFENWESKRWSVIDTVGSADLGVGDVVTFAFDPVEPKKIAIRDVECPHGTLHGLFWIGVVCEGSGDTASGKTRTSSTSFDINSSKPAKERLKCTFEDLPLPGKQRESMLGAASWTAEEGGNGGTNPGQDPEDPGNPGQKPPKNLHKPGHS